MRARDARKAVCEVARPTWYRNTIGPEGSPERAVWVRVWSCVFVWVWLVFRPSLDEWIYASVCMDTLQTPIQALRHSPFSASFIPSIYPSLFKWTLRMLEWELRCGRVEHSRMHRPVSGHVATESGYELANVCLCSSLEMLHSPPHFTVIPW